MNEIKLTAGDIIRIHPMVFVNTNHPIFITDESKSINVVIFYDASLGTLAFEAFHFVFPISFVLDQKDKYPLHIIGNANKNPELLEDENK